MPSKVVKSTPYELWKGKRPSLKYFKIWDCPAYVRNVFGHKLSARADKCRFVGYPKEGMGYLFYHPTEQKVFVSRHATFLEKEFIQEKGNERIFELEEVQPISETIPQPDVPRFRNNHNTHLLFAGKRECKVHLSDMALSLGMIMKPVSYKMMIL